MLLYKAFCFAVNSNKEEFFFLSDSSHSFSFLSLLLFSTSKIPPHFIKTLHAMLKKIFQNPTKRKRQEVKQRHNTSKVTMDPVSTAILSRHFSPLSCKAVSPSDLIDIVGYPAPANNIKSFSQSSPELTTLSLQLSKNIHQEDLDQEEHEEIQQIGRVQPKQQQGRQQPRQQRLTIRNNTTPPPPLLDTETTTRNDILLLETSREDKTLVEEDQAAAQAEKSLLGTKKYHGYTNYPICLNFFFTWR